MSNDRYENIRKALAIGPTPGPWELRDGRTDTVENAQGYPVCTVHWHPNERYGHGVRAAYIVACDPDTIRALLAERDALAQDAERYRWLRSETSPSAEVMFRPDGDFGFHALWGDELDAAIDAAIAAANGGGND